MSIAPRQPIALAVAQFEDIVNRGLQSLIAGDPHLRLVATDVPQELMETTLERDAPDVAILNFAALTSPAELRELHATFPSVRLMVMANNPSTAECRQMIGFGATACLAKNTEENLLAQGLSQDQVRNVTYDPNAANFDAEIQQMVEFNPDAIVLIGFDESSRILQGLNAQGIGPQR